MRKQFPLSLFLVFAYFTLTAQIEVGLTFGVASYQGDMHQLSDENINVFSEAHLNYGVLTRYKFNESFAFRGQLSTLTLSGSDSNFSTVIHQERNYSFENTIFEATGMLEWDILGHRRPRNRSFTRFSTPYLFVGAGTNFTSPEVMFSFSEDPEERANMSRDLRMRNIFFALPVGAGWRFELVDGVSFGLEGTIRLPVTDYYDGVSYAANPNTNDSYGSLNAFLTIHFDKQDYDGDGIANRNDECPTIAGLLTMNGCPDTDADGIRDEDDTCPLYAGLKKYDGCPDSDGDGTIDKNDKCPNVMGYKTRGGCPDADRDWVIDSEDECPNQEGSKWTKGCPDTDGDGVADKDDRCPEEAGLVSENGCPFVEENTIVDVNTTASKTRANLARKGTTDFASKEQALAKVATEASNLPTEKAAIEAEILTSFENIYFETNNATLNNSRRMRLDQIADIMQSNASYSLNIKGYSDSIGVKAANKNISNHRAKVCYDYLISRGIVKNRIQYMGLGSENPIGENSTLEGRSMNRRVEFELKNN